MLRISSLTPLLISILALFAAAQLDRRHQDKESFVTVPLTQDSNLTPTRRSTLATNMGKDAVNLERRWTEFLVNNIPPILRKISYIDHLLPVTVKSGQKLALIDQGIYTGKITIGSPPQTFSVGFATSLTISEIGIPGPNHKTNEPVQNALYKKNKYIARDSPTHMENTHHIKQKVDNGKGKNKAIEKTIEKTDGLGTAIEYRDTMTIANIEVTGQYFIGVVTPPFIDAISAEDGSIALGFRSLSPGALPTFMETALRQNKITHPLFGVSFALPNPEFHFGGTNAQLYTTPIQYHNVLPFQMGDRRPTYWLLGNARIFLQEKGEAKLVLDNLKTIIATDSMLTYGPSDEVDEIYKPIKNELTRRADGTYEFPCGKGPKVKISWDGKKKWDYLGFEIPLTENLCFGSIAAYVGKSKWGTRWKIGTSFLKNVYTGFDMGNKQVMFAQLRSPEVG